MISTDDEFVLQLEALDCQGKDGIPAMRELLKPPGQLSRLIKLAVRGATRAKRTAPKSSTTFITDDFPTEADREHAIAYWRKNRRPDLEVRMDEQIEKFRHHFGNVKAKNWPRRWGTWYRNAIDYTRPAQGIVFADVSFEQTDANGWLRRLVLYRLGDEDCPKDTWSPKWGPTPDQSDNRVPPEAERLFQARYGAQPELRLA